MAFYRFSSGGRGIYAAVNEDCPADHPHRAQKPDGSWLPRVGMKFPGSSSFWTEAGLEKYLRSGLQDWHRRAIKHPLFIEIADTLPEPLYIDALQWIVPSIHASAQNWDDFVALKAPKEKAYAYVIREGSEVLVFEHETRFSDAGIQAPGGTLDPGETPEIAVLRELQEEAGIAKARIIRKVRTDFVFHPFNHQYQKRHFFELKSESELPSHWEHQVSGSGDDLGKKFFYSWMPISEARWRLIAGLGDALAGVLP